MGVLGVNFEGLVVHVTLRHLLAMTLSCLFKKNLCQAIITTSKCDILMTDHFLCNSIAIYFLIKGPQSKVPKEGILSTLLHVVT